MLLLFMELTRITGQVCIIAFLAVTMYIYIERALSQLRYWKRYVERFF